MPGGKAAIETADVLHKLRSLTPSLRAEAAELDAARAFPIPSLTGFATTACSGF
jgi:hypothetical protein